MQFSTVLAKRPLLTTNCKLLKGIVCTTKEILPLFTHPQVSKSVCIFFISETENDILFRFPVTSTICYVYIMVVNGNQKCLITNILKYLLLCSAGRKKRKPYRFGLTWGLVINDRIYIFGVGYPLIIIQKWTHFMCVHAVCIFLSEAIILALNVKQFWLNINK